MDRDVRHGAGLEQAAQRRWGYPTPGDVQDVQGPRHPDLLCDSPAHSKGGANAGSLGSFQPKPL